MLLIPTRPTARSSVRLAQAAPAGVTVATDIASTRSLRSGHPLRRGLTASGTAVGTTTCLPESPRRRSDLVCRTGYTGERGYKLVVRWRRATDLGRGGAAGEPYGLQMADSALGHDAHRDGNHCTDRHPPRSPRSARLAWAVGWTRTVLRSRGAPGGEAGRCPPSAAGLRATVAASATRHGRARRRCHELGAVTSVRSTDSETASPWPDRLGGLNRRRGERRVRGRAEPFVSSNRPS